MNPLYEMLLFYNVVTGLTTVRMSSEGFIFTKDCRFGGVSCGRPVVRISRCDRGYPGSNPGHKSCC